LWREPLLHFAVLGGLVFGLHAAVSGGDDQVLRVNDALVDRLAREQQLRTGRTPDAAEREALLQQHLDDEMLMREALARGLARKDPMIRRRLVQAMRFLLESEGALEAPIARADQVARQPERYTAPVRIDFEQVFFAQTDARDCEAEARTAKQHLAPDGVRPAALGDPFLHGAELSGVDGPGLRRMFGEAAARAIEQLPVGGWQGPIRSPYGAHLVRVLDRDTPSGPDPVGYERQIDRDVAISQRSDALANGLDRLRARYRVERD
jgi:hypothetical protein